MQFYELATLQQLPADAIVVHVHENSATLSADIDRRLTTIGGSVSPEEHEGPLTVLVALERATEMLETLKTHGFERICIVLHDGTDWNPAWGTLVRP